ncbi:cysteine protease StiP domain-containing protein [Leisingera caerulea]|uniref:cysteine protease StiP domain-containing protein n=1 Tax=Leisingera caerulea TaxID=506591 RepID=UPI000415C886|nr:cysteine protease StiP domain-containing protein [Leisingera caerulea]
MFDNSSTRVPFSGSYAKDDVDFLLKPVQMRPTGIDEKEAAIQSGRRHYSEMISEEARPDQRYLSIFEDAWQRGRERIAAEVMAIAREIRAGVEEGSLPAQVTLCSLVRAGAPLGVLLHRALRDLGVDSAHFGISIIRDRGIDMNAMRYVMGKRDPDGILFVDGWTGKGAITRELRHTWTENTGRRPVLVVLADPCGMADIAGSNDDWLIPSGILGANISGLISRSILNADVVGENDFHGCIPVDHLQDIDYSARFVDDIHGLMRQQQGAALAEAVCQDQSSGTSNALTLDSASAVTRIMEIYQTENPNRVKPGIAEATRAVLRRKPHHVLVSSEADPDLQALIHLCKEGGVDYSVRPDLTGPYRAVTVISKVS